MMSNPTVTIRAISLGSFRELDTFELLGGANNASSLVNRSFGGANAPLTDRLVDMTLGDGNHDGQISFANHTAGTEYISVGGVRQAVDTGIVYNGTVTYADGTSRQNVPLRIIQDGAGNLYLMPPSASADPDEVAAMTQKPITSIRITSVAQNNFNRLDVSRYGLATPGFLCFRHGTRILTDQGEVAVEDLRPGDLVVTRDHGPRPIRWIGARAVAGAVQRAFPRLRPVRIAAGALGPGLPARDLWLSRQHRVLVASRIAGRIFGEDEVLLAARHLLGLPGIAIDESDTDLGYFHILLDRHEILLSEGAQTESLFTGPEAVQMMDPGARAEILALFPALLRAQAAPPPVRPIGLGRQGRQLARRHLRNGQPVQAPVAG